MAGGGSDSLPPQARGDGISDGCGGPSGASSAPPPFHFPSQEWEDQHQRGRSLSLELDPPPPRLTRTGWDAFAEGKLKRSNDHLRRPQLRAYCVPLLMSISGTWSVWSGSARTCPRSRSRPARSQARSPGLPPVNFTVPSADRSAGLAPPQDTEQCLWNGNSQRVEFRGRPLPTEVFSLAHRVFKNLSFLKCVANMYKLYPNLNFWIFLKTEQDGQARAHLAVWPPWLVPRTGHLGQRSLLSPLHGPPASLWASCPSGADVYFYYLLCPELVTGMSPRTDLASLGTVHWLCRPLDAFFCLEDLFFPFPSGPKVSSSPRGGPSTLLSRTGVS